MRKEREKPNSVDIQNQFYDISLTYFRDNIQNGNFISYIALEDDKIIATSGLCYYIVPPTYDVLNGKVAYIMNMYTKPQYRKKGIATKLLDCTVHEAINNGCHKIFLNASEMGQSIYKNYGFKEIQNEMVYNIKY